MFAVNPVAVKVVPTTGVPEVPIPAPAATTCTEKFVAVGCVQFITALSEPRTVVIPVTVGQAVITLTLSTNHVSPEVPDVPV